MKKEINDIVTLSWAFNPVTFDGYEKPVEWKILERKKENGITKVLAAPVTGYNQKEDIFKTREAITDDTQKEWFEAFKFLENPIII
jgi:hypothetical protein